MDVCNPVNNIGTYVSSSGGGGSTPSTWTITSTETSTVNQQIKNIDAVSVEANLVSCDVLTVAGQTITGGLADLNTKTQNQTATEGTTTFVGTVNAASLNATGGTFTASTINTQYIVPTTEPVQIGGTNKTLVVNSSTQRVGVNTTTPTTALDVTGTTKTTTLQISPTTTSSTTNCINCTNSSLGVAEYRFLLGASESSNNGGYLSFARASTTSGDANNKMSLYLNGTSKPRLDVTGTNVVISSPVSVNGSVINNYLGNGQINDSNLAASYSFTTFTARSFTVSFYNVSVTTGAWRMDLTVGGTASSSGCTIGSKGNSSTSWTSGGLIRLLNDTTTSLPGVATCIMNGNIRFEMVGGTQSAPVFVFFGTTTVIAPSVSTTYSNEINGQVTVSSGFPLTLTLNSTLARATGTFYLSYL